MCEAKAYLKKENGLELFMEDVVSITPENSTLILKDILGHSKTIEGKIVEIGLLDHKVVLEITSSGNL